MLKRIKDHIGNHPSWIAPILFFTINLIQGIFTPLLNDEPYYWLWSQTPALGYFDHPPMVAWLIGLGTLLFENEIGVRILSILCGSLTLYFLYKIIEAETTDKVNIKLFLLLPASSVFINLYTFMAIPDTPLLFFTTLFLWQFRKYFYNNTAGNSVLLGIVCALLLYSKYHGILVIGLAVLANYKLMARKSFYLVLVTALLLFTPHLWWQYANDFPSIRFHLFEKIGAFRVKNIASYIGEQLAVTGPVLLLLFTVLHRTRNQYQFTLKFVTLGIFFFFLYSSFRGMVNSYWTLAAWPGLIIISYLYIREFKRYRSIIISTLSFSLLVILLIRVNFLFNIYPVPHFNNRNPELMATELRQHTNHPLVFINQFIDPALYLFYQNETCFAINNIRYKKTQFNYLPQPEEEVQGKTVTLVSSLPVNETSYLLPIYKGRNYYLTDFSNFKSYQTQWNVKTKAVDKHISAGSTFIIPVKIEMKTIENRNRIKRPTDCYLSLNMQNLDNKNIYSFHQQYEVLPVEPFDFITNAPIDAGTYKFYFSITNDTLIHLRSYNSNIQHVIIE